MKERKGKVGKRIFSENDLGAATARIIILGNVKHAVYYSILSKAPSLSICASQGEKFTTVPTLK